MPIRQFQAQRMHAPRDFQAIANTPVCIEIGAGKGKHALLFSGQHPEQTLYAIERTREKFLAMQKQHGLEPRANLQPVHADALPWIVHALYPAQVEQCFILYPNPEPHNPAQRWLNMPFFEFLLSRLQPNGRLPWPVISLNILPKLNSNYWRYGNYRLRNSGLPPILPGPILKLNICSAVNCASN